MHPLFYILWILYGLMPFLVVHFTGNKIYQTWEETVRNSIDILEMALIFMILVELLPALL